MDELTIEQICGWHPSPAAVEEALAAAPGNGKMQDATPHLMETWDTKSDIPLWEACRKVNNGENLPADLQTIGDCVSHGHARGVDYLQCIQIAIGNLPFEYKEGETSAYSEALYGNMRELGNDLSMQDGAVGAWAVQSLVRDGFPMRKGRTYDGQRAKQYGYRGTPKEIKAEGSGFKLVQYVQPKTTREAGDLLFNGYPITICSNQGFTMKRDANGICEASGTWAHCMLCIGVLVINGELIFVILQSWGQNTPSGPTIKNMPNNSFGCREKVFQRILNANDSYGLSSIPGMPTQEMNFYV